MWSEVTGAGPVARGNMEYFSLFRITCNFQELQELLQVIRMFLPKSSYAGGYCVFYCCCFNVHECFNIKEKGIFKQALQNEKLNCFT